MRCVCVCVCVCASSTTALALCVCVCVRGVCVCVCVRGVGVYVELLNHSMKWTSVSHPSFLTLSPSSPSILPHLPSLPPSQPYGGGMFGRSLEETMQVEARLGGNYVPVLLHRCIKFVRDHGTKFSSPISYHLPPSYVSSKN